MRSATLRTAPALVATLTVMTPALAGGAIVASAFAIAPSANDLRPAHRPTPAPIRLRRIGRPPAAAAAAAGDASDAPPPPPPPDPAPTEGRSSPLDLVLIGAWATAVGAFLRVNQSYGCWPASLLRPSPRSWALIHAVAGMLFSGAVVLSTLVEWLAVRSGSPPVLRFWFRTAPRLDGAVVLPALTGAIVSGAAQAAQTYGSLGSSPVHVRGSVHLLTTFAVWWACTDLTTQRSARRAVSEWCRKVADSGAGADAEVPRVLYKRRWSNVVSCLFVVALYALMALKPGYPES